jgi:hypothetical protein
MHLKKPYNVICNYISLHHIYGKGHTDLGINLQWHYVVYF